MIKGWHVEVRVTLRYGETDKRIGSTTQSVIDEQSGRELYELQLKNALSLWPTRLSDRDTGSR